jgi:RNA polymerase sigma factor (sigma-70 family)
MGFKRNAEFIDSTLDPLSFERNERLIHKLTNKIMKRVLALHLAWDAEDVFQDVCERFVIATKTFNPDAGAQFSTYFVTSVWNWINKRIERELGSVSTHALSLVFEGDDESFDFAERLPDERASEERAWAQAQALKNVRNLSKEAKVALRLIINPPEFLLEELEKRRAKSGRVYELEFRTISFFLQQLLGLDRYDINRIRLELQEAADL